MSHCEHFPNGSVGKWSTFSAEDAGDADSIPGLGKSPGGENGTPLQYSCLENPIVYVCVYLSIYLSMYTHTYMYMCFA